jgi:hypothetical protein
VLENSLEPNAAKHCSIAGGGALWGIVLRSQVEKFPDISGTRKLITAFSRALCWPHEICQWPTSYLKDPFYYRPIYLYPKLFFPSDLLVAIKGKHNRSLHVAVQGPDFCGPPLCIHSYWSQLCVNFISSVHPTSSSRGSSSLTLILIIFGEEYKL